LFTDAAGIAILIRNASSLAFDLWIPMLEGNRVRDERVKVAASEGLKAYLPRTANGESAGALYVLMTFGFSRP
jgi:hypothetical protein